MSNLANDLGPISGTMGQIWQMIWAPPVAPCVKFGR